jgi:hypothetical protein
MHSRRHSPCVPHRRAAAADLDRGQSARDAHTRRAPVDLGGGHPFGDTQCRTASPDLGLGQVDPVTQRKGAQSKSSPGHTRVATHTRRARRSSEDQTRSVIQESLALGSCSGQETDDLQSEPARAVFPPATFRALSPLTGRRGSLAALPSVARYPEISRRAAR